MSEPETLEFLVGLRKIAEGLAGQMFEVDSGDTFRHNAGLILAALREVEEEFDLRAREQQELAGIYKQRAEKAEAEVERLRAALTACQVAANDIAEDNERLRDRLNGELK